MLKITEELRDELVEYLSFRPYRESAVAISKLSRLEKIEEIKKEEVKK